MHKFYYCFFFDLCHIRAKLYKPLTQNVHRVSSPHRTPPLPAGRRAQGAPQTPGHCARSPGDLAHWRCRTAAVPPLFAKRPTCWRFELMLHFWFSVGRPPSSLSDVSPRGAGLSWPKGPPPDPAIPRPAPTPKPRPTPPRPAPHHTTPHHTKPTATPTPTPTPTPDHAIYLHWEYTCSELYPLDNSCTANANPVSKYQNVEQK